MAGMRTRHWSLLMKEARVGVPWGGSGRCHAVLTLGLKPVKRYPACYGDHLHDILQYSGDVAFQARLRNLGGGTTRRLEGGLITMYSQTEFHLIKRHTLLAFVGLVNHRCAKWRREFATKGGRMCHECPTQQPLRACALPRDRHCHLVVCVHHELGGLLPAYHCHSPQSGMQLTEPKDAPTAPRMAPASDWVPKRLGVCRFYDTPFQPADNGPEQYVIPGNIIYRQRGTLWFPGENVGMGRDHTIYATQTGYVKYYKDPLKHPKRKYIGVAFERNQSLPTPLNAARRRRLSMVAVPRTDIEATSELPPTEVDTISETSVKMTPSQLRVARKLKASGRLPTEQLRLRPDYSYRESNYDIGRAAERAGVPQPYYKPNNRFVAWRKRTVRKQAAAEKRSMSRKSGKKSKK
ncbi:hypothetical protein FH972_024529 [Carpinus fangiana]|uniref:Large ribosomal subunit protein bL27m n=1 Tax=Carpinus fangiana TaxID=176857 RepID=A0A5N6KY97_9ROSI|nr:hypothetical protein FH972_024529 [Carpinus fangiana]